MAELEKVIYSIERCICHVPDACRDCGYDNEPCPKCFEHLLRDAHDLLKAQEPMVMTLEDAKQTMEGEIVWVEQWTKSKVFLMPMVSTGDGRLGNFYLGLNLNEMNPHYYRVWRGKPTDEQREAVKWD